MKHEPIAELHVTIPGRTDVYVADGIGKAKTQALMLGLLTGKVKDVTATIYYDGRRYRWSQSDYQWQLMRDGDE